MDLFDIAAKITLNTSEYQKSLEGADKSGSSFSEKLKTGLGNAAKVGAAAVAAVGTGVFALGTKFVSGLKDVASYGDEVDKMSQKLGLSKQAYQEWDYVLGQAGVDITNMSTGLKTLTNKIDDAKNGGEEAQKQFEALGISLEDLDTMSREDIFAEVISGFQGMEDSTTRAALANDLFGKSGQELTPLFNSSIEETKQLREAANDLGFVMSNYAVSSAASFNDSLDTLTRTVGGIKNQFLQNFLPAAAMVMDGLTAIFSGDSESGIGMIETGIERIVTQLSLKIPKFLDIGWGIVDALLTAINDNLPMLIEKGADLLLNGIIPGILDKLPELVTTAFSIISQLATSIGEALPELIPAIISIILQIVDTLLSPEGIDLLIDGAIGLIMGLADGIISAVPMLIERVPEIIVKLVEAIIRNAPKLLSAAWELVKKLGEGLANAGASLVKVGRPIVEKIGEGISNAFSRVASWARDGINKLKEGFLNIVDRVKTIGREIVNKIKEGFKEKIEAAKNWGADLIKNFADGMMSKLNALKDKVKSVASSIKSFLGFSEPEEGPLSNFHTYAPDMMNLFMKGIKDNERKLDQTVADAFDFEPIISANSNISASGSGARSGGASGNMVVNITVNAAPGQSEKAIADNVARILQSQYNSRKAVFA